MNKAFVTFFFRLVSRNKLNFLIKGIGLGVSLLAVILVSLYISDEFSFDKFHKDANRIFRLTTTSMYGESENTYSRTPVPLARHIEGLKSLEYTARVYERSASVNVPATGLRLNADNVWFADSSLVRVFDFNTIKGSTSEALYEPNNVILSETAAFKFFGSTDVIGKTIRLEDSLDLSIVAVIEDFPRQSSFHFQMIVPFQLYFQLENPANIDYLQSDWIYTSVFTFVKSTPGVSAAVIDREIASLQSSIVDERARENVKWRAQPFSDIHLFSQMSGEQGNMRITYVYLLASIAFGLLTIAVINYTSLTAAEWTNRSKELHVRQMSGSSKTNIVRQFSIETAMTFIVMIPVVLTVVYTMLPAFNELAEKQLSFYDVFRFSSIIVILVVLITYLLSTAIVVLAVSSGRSVKSTRNVIDKKLVVIGFQTVIAIVVCCFSLTIYRQLVFIETKNKGFVTEGMITIPLFSSNFNSVIGQVTGDHRGRMNFFEEQVQQNPSVKAISCSAFKPGEGGISALVETQKITSDANVFIPLNSVDFDFLETYDIALIAGRGFSREFGTDHLKAFIINEEAVNLLGFRNAEEAIGQDITAVGKQGHIVGVMKNFHFEGLQHAIRPLMFEVAAWKFSNFSVRIDPSKTTEALHVLKSQWDKLFPETVFQYEFLENDLRTNYAMESNLGALSKSIGIASVLLALLGLYVSSIHKAGKDVRSMTVRKVLGANALQLVTRFAAPYFTIALISYSIAVPFSLFVSQQWLSSFAYRTQLGIVDFLVILIITFILITFILTQQMVKLVSLNPVKNLRTE